jgi:hypothetical protein
MRADEAGAAGDEGGAAWSVRAHAAPIVTIGGEETVNVPLRGSPNLVLAGRQGRMDVE